MSNGMRWYKVRSCLTELFAPNVRCLNCGAEVFDKIGFCNDCRKTLPYNNGKTCLHCGVAIDGEEDYCGNCGEEKNYFDRVYSAFSYDGGIRKAILSMKFGNCGSYARILSRYLAFIADKHNLQFDVVTFVPMSATAKRKRGYNQSELLARGFCDIINADEKFVSALCKVKDTTPQEKLGKMERKQNLVGCFAVANGVDLKGKHVLLVDDVKTTGATANECAKVLKRKGAASVVVVTVASRPENFVYEIEQ